MLSKDDVVCQEKSFERYSSGEDLVTSVDFGNNYDFRFVSS